MPCTSNEMRVMNVDGSNQHPLVTAAALAGAEHPV
jgi:hypothetical protein